MIREFSTKLGEQFINTFTIVYMQSQGRSQDSIEGFNACA